MMNDFAAIILAAGKGARFQSTTVNKVALPLGGKPMIVHVVDFVQKLAIHPIIVVVGFAKNSVIDVLKGKDVVFAQQDEQLGTGDAVAAAVKHLPSTVDDVLVVQGDDAFFYRQENETFVKGLIDKHVSSGASLSLLTTTLENPYSVGRIARDEIGNVVAIIEEHEATDTQKKIKEVNIACYVFAVSFLRKYLPKLSPSPRKGEYLLTDLVNLAFSHNEKVEVVDGGAIPWRSVNTQDELLEANVILQNREKKHQSR